MWALIHLRDRNQRKENDWYEEVVSLKKEVQHIKWINSFELNRICEVEHFIYIRKMTWNGRFVFFLSMAVLVYITMWVIDCLQFLKKKVFIVEFIKCFNWVSPKCLGNNLFEWIYRFCPCYKSPKITSLNISIRIKQLLNWNGIN